MSSSKGTAIQVWYCDNCTYGPLNYTLDPYCPSCGHLRCAYCTYTLSTIKTRNGGGGYRSSSGNLSRPREMQEPLYGSSSAPEPETNAKSGIPPARLKDPQLSTNERPQSETGHEGSTSSTIEPSVLSEKSFSGQAPAKYRAAVPQPSQIKTRKDITSEELHVANDPSKQQWSESKSYPTSVPQGRAIKLDELRARPSSKPIDPHGYQQKSVPTVQAFQTTRTLWQHHRNMISDRLQNAPSASHVQVSWTCRCGHRLHIHVPVLQLQAAIDFAAQAAGPNAHTVTSRRPVEQGGASASSSSQASTNTELPQANSTNSGPRSPHTSSSDEEVNSVLPPFIPTGTKRFLLLCVNTGSLGGVRHRRLANVEVTNTECGGELFQSLRNAYYSLRKSTWNPFLIPKTMHYVKFQLLFLQRSGEVVGTYEVNSIPPAKEVLTQAYDFRPCPPRVGGLPIPRDIFMHSFLNPGDHLGPMVVEMLPKKLWAELRWDGQAHDHFNIPTGWGFYIVEGIYWGLVWWWTVLLLVAVSILTVTWSALMGDVQGGTGLGQYCLAALAVLGSVGLWHYNVRGISSRELLVE